MNARLPGFGDVATWGAFAGHPNDPRAPDDDSLLTERDAREQARDEIASTPRVIGEWLHNECYDDGDALDLRALRRACVTRPLSVPECAVMLLLGSDAEAMRAVQDLRDAFRAQNASVVAERAAELLRQQSDELRRAVEDEMAERAGCDA